MFNIMYKHDVSIMSDNVKYLLKQLLIYGVMMSLAYL